jgi:hypothetical protein
MPLNVACTNEQMVPITAAPTSQSGNPAPIDGALRVTVQSGDGSVVQDPATPLTFMAVSGAALGDTVFLVEADADMGAGSQTIQDLVTLSVTGAVAANFGFTAGAPVPKA